ncbi:MAG: hypothetical protein R3D00_01160 [Bacteroidia bacterium]
MISCQKNPLEKTQPESSLEVANPHNLALIQQASGIALFPEIVNENGILHFSNLDHYNSTLEQLALMENQWVDEYSLNESDHIIPDEALEAFEDMLEFYSLRKFIEQDEDVFLRSGSENWADRLEVTHFIKDDYVRTVLNPSAEIIIGNSVFKYVTNEVIVEITDGNMNTLEIVRNYFASQDDIITTVPAGMGGGNVILHYPNFSVPIIVTGPSVETCPSTAFELLLQWDASDKSAMDLSVGLSDNVSSILAMNSGLLASQFDLLVSNVDGTNITSIFSFSVPHSHGTRKFYVHSESVASFHNVEDNNDTESGILRLTDNCN